MTENEFILQDRIAKIQATVGEYDEQNFYIAFSGGKDSTVVSALIDMALPDNKIPRVYADTGIEYNLIRDFVKSINDDRYVIIRPSKSIKETLNEFGYPFKSKLHSKILDVYQRNGMTKGVSHYIGRCDDSEKWSTEKSCPKCLKYQFTDDFSIKVSDRCCRELKEKPLNKWMKENKKKYGINGIMREEGGRRMKANCMSYANGKFKMFQPLALITKEWEEWFIRQYNIELCDIYKPPYSFVRTGCKGCPFSLKLQEQLDVLEKFFPAERKQCEIIWKPVYEEYKRIGYRLKEHKEGEHGLSDANTTEDQ